MLIYKFKTLKLSKIGFKYIVLMGFVFINSIAFSVSPIRHNIIGGTFVFETHFNSNLQGFEINLNRHYSSCTHANYLNSFGFNMLYGENHKEMGVSYTGRLFKKISGHGHGGWNLIYKVNPNLIKGNESDMYLIKPGVGGTIYTGARLGFFVVQAFALYNYNVYLQKEQSFDKMSNHSLQMGVFIGVNAFGSNSFRFLRYRIRSRNE